MTFSKKDGHDLGKTDIVQHKIDVGDHPPIKATPYQVPYSQRSIISQQVKSMLENNIIKPSPSPWSSNVVLVKKNRVTTILHRLSKAQFHHEKGKLFTAAYRRNNRFSRKCLLWACSHEPRTVNYPGVMVAPGQALPRVHMMICCPGATMSRVNFIAQEQVQRHLITTNV